MPRQGVLNNADVALLAAAGGSWTRAKNRVRCGKQWHFSGGGAAREGEGGQQGTGEGANGRPQQLTLAGKPRLEKLDVCSPFRITL